MRKIERKKINDTIWKRKREYQLGLQQQQKQQPKMAFDNVQSWIQIESVREISSHVYKSESGEEKKLWKKEKKCNKIGMERHQINTKRSMNNAINATRSIVVCQSFHNFGHNLVARLFFSSSICRHKFVAYMSYFHPINIHRTHFDSQSKSKSDSYMYIIIPCIAS